MHYEAHFSEIILNLGIEMSFKESEVKEMSFKDSSIFSTEAILLFMRIISMKLFWIWISGSTCAFYVDSIMRNISVKLFWIWASS